MSDTLTEDLRWKWMMDYCLANNLPAAQNWAWAKANEAWRNKSPKD